MIQVGSDAPRPTGTRIINIKKIIEPEADWESSGIRLSRLRKIRPNVALGVKYELNDK